MGTAVRTKAGWFGIIAGFVIAMLVWQAVPAWLSSMEPTGTMIADARVLIVDPAQPAYALAVEAEVLVSDRCRRTTHYVLVDVPARRVFPLGPTVSGDGFSTPWDGRYSVMLSVPAAIPPGAYALSVRAVYDCSYLGLFRWQIAQQAAPIPVRIQ